jgi:hypothetical protein
MMDTVAKYWVGVGALKQKDDNFRQMVLSPIQLEAAKCEYNTISIQNLDGKNFSRIRLLQ